MTVCICLLLAAPSLLAQEPGEEEAPKAIALSCPDKKLGPAVPVAPDRSQSPIIIYAKELDASKEREGEARGAVELFRLDQHMATEQVLFDPIKETVTLPGAVAYQDQQVWVNGEKGHYNFTDESGQL